MSVGYRPTLMKGDHMKRDRALTKCEAAYVLGVRPTSIGDSRWRKRIGLRATRVGKSLRFLESEVNRVLRRGLENPHS